MKLVTPRRIHKHRPLTSPRMAEARLKPCTDRKCRVIIIADSRGAGLQSEIDILNDGNYDIKVIIRKGRGMTQAVIESTNKLMWTRPDQIVVLAGICDITRKDRITKMVSLQDSDADLILGRIDNSLGEIEHHLSLKLTERSYTVTFCPITGMDIAKYNGLVAEHPDQENLDRIIVEVNKAIIARNSMNHVVTPWTASEVHYNKKGGRKKTRYYKLASDGLHLSDTLKEKWARILYNAIVQMHEDPPSRT